MSYQMPSHANANGSSACGHFPQLVRMNYFYGQMLGPRDFMTEQAYHRAKHLLINRCLLGYGVVCGLIVEPVPCEEPCPDPQEEKISALDGKIVALENEIEKIEAANDKDGRLAKMEAELEELRRQSDELGKAGTTGTVKSAKHLIKVSCGFAIDPMGHEIVVGHDVIVDLDAHLSEADKEKLGKKRRGTLYVSICYAECGLEPVRPAALDQCEITPGCRDARTLEGFRITVSFEPPKTDERCEFCCDGVCDSCVLLSKIVFDAGCPLKPESIDNGVRRRFGLYAPTVITGINWMHGATYSPDGAEALLGTGQDHGGLEIRFSRPIHVSTIKPGVVELLSFAGGRGVAGEITHISGEFINLPSTGMVDRILYRDTTDERPRPGDRILVIVRCDFLLDACCRPVDGNHVGGRVPFIGNHMPYDQHTPKAGHEHTDPKQGQYHTDEPCVRPPGHPGAWTSGNGVPGGSFESWFFIARDKETV